MADVVNVFKESVMQNIFNLPTCLGAYMSKFFLVAVCLLAVATHYAKNQGATLSVIDKNVMLDVISVDKSPGGPFKLESSVLALVDGNFVNADTLERIYSFKREVLAIMRGDKINNETSYQGRYIFNGYKFSALAIAKQEYDALMSTSNGDESKHHFMEQRDACLQSMKDDFLKASDKLKAVAYGAKAMMEMLIEESCKKHYRLNSILLLWAHTPEEQEDAIFNERVKTVTDFVAFCRDLLNFTGDLLYSCPRAHDQFEQRAKKWKQFESSLIVVLGSKKPSQKFLEQIKLKLDIYSFADLTPNNIRLLLDEFNKKQHSA